MSNQVSDWPTSILKSVAIIPKVGGALSLIACTLIIRDVSLKAHSKRSVALTSVVVFCISIADWLSSLFSAFIGTWMVPVDSGYYLASGNTNTCTAQGFITTFAVAMSMSYYASLMILYYMIVRLGWTESRMSKLKLRLSFILPPIIISLGLAIPPLFLEFYNHGGSYTCFISTHPFDCEANPEVDCTRGEGAWEYYDAFWIYGFVCNLVIIVFVSMLVYTVFQQEKKTDKYLTKGMEKRRVHTIKTAWQGLRYIGAFFLAYFTLYVITACRLTNQMPPLAILYMHWILTPLLGFFNSFVYFRPRYLTYRDNNPDESWVICLSNVFNIDLDYLESSRSKALERLSTISRRSISRSVTSTLSRGWTGSGSEFQSESSTTDGDLTSPLFQDDSSENETREKKVSFSV